MSDLNQQIAAARETLAQCRNATLSAQREKQRVNKIPLKSAGGSKGAKRDAHRALEDARRAEMGADTALRHLEKTLLEQKKAAENAPQSASHLQPLESNNTVRDSEPNPDASISSQPKKELQPGSPDHLDSDIEMDASSTASGTATTGGDASDHTNNASQSTHSAKAGIDEPMTPASEVSAESQVPEVTDKQQPGDKDEGILEGMVKRKAPEVTADKQQAEDKDEGIPEGTAGVKRKAPEVTVDKQQPEDEDERIPDGTAGVKRKARSSKAKADDDDDDAEIVSFDDLPDEEKAILQEKGEKAIKAFLTKKKPVPFHLRRLVRDAQEFLPAAATTSRELALHFLSTNRGNDICLFHQKSRHFKQVDGYGQKYILVGVPHHKVLASTKGKSASASVPPEGHMHCGCSINVALMDFFWWKTWSLESTKPGLQVKESMRDDVLPTRARAFFFKAFVEATGMTIDDLYASKAGSLGFDSKAVRLYQIRKLLAEVNETNGSDGSPTWLLNVANNSTGL